jgi:hypothetical protein
MDQEYTDLDVMHLEADMIETLTSMKSIVDQYVDTYPYLSLTPENSDALQAYYQGLMSISLGTKSIAAAFRAVCACKNIKV